MTRVVSELPRGEEKTALVRSMFDAIAPRYDLVNRVMTFGLDLLWRRQAVHALAVPEGSVVLDVACGTGDLLTVLRSAGHRAFGVDLSWGMLGADRSGAPLLQGDAEHLAVADRSVDAVTCGYALRNVAELDALFAELARVVRPGGRISLLEVAEPEGGVLRAGHRVWFRHAVPAIGALLSDRAAYRYLPASTAYLPAPEELRRLLVEARFSTVNRHLLSGGLSQVLTATRSGRP
jgi:demethylmenaquinone methyltransferase/2-methoxy-6-polyprenyl-1,4-benzoquinol methylase